MLRLHRILIPFDASPASEQALEEALWLARRTDAEIKILQVEILHGESVPSQWDPALETETLRARMKDLIMNDSEAPGAFDPDSVQISHVVDRDFAAAPAIVDYADEHEVDLIVMGTHGRRGVSRLLLGSVAEEVVRHAPCPVLTVRARKDRQPETRAVQSIVVPVDFSQHSRIALTCAHEWAVLYNARIDVVHVIEDDLHPDFYFTHTPTIYDAQPEIEDQARIHLEQLNREVGSRAVEAHFHILSGRAAGQIVDFAEDSGADLIVMSTHGLTGMNRFLIGSVAEKVVRHAGCPVLTVKAFGKSLVEGVPDTSAAERGNA